MFAQNNPSPFGSPPGQPIRFGKAQPAVGSPPATPFGRQPAAATPFGGGTTFGAPPAPSGMGTTNPFGSSTPAFGTTTTTFGAQPQQQQPGTSAFGGGGFGTAAPAFGSMAPATNIGLVGNAAAPAGGSLFGSGGATGTFGSTVTSTFGGGGLGRGTAFGSTPSFGQQATPVFGTLPSGDLFRAPAPAPARSNPFGIPSRGVDDGTLGAPYQVTARQDGTNSSYAQGNKGTGAGAAVSTPPVGFGGFPPVSTFGAPVSETFRAAPAPVFGLTGTFGETPAPAPTTLGAPASPFVSQPSTSLAPAPAFGGFGATPVQPLFGAPAPALGTTSFGQAPRQSVFGQVPGVSNPANHSLFGKSCLLNDNTKPLPNHESPFIRTPAQGGLFDSNPVASPGLCNGAPAVGAPAPVATGGLCGQPPAAPTGVLFRQAAPAPLVGQPAPAFSGSSFGGQAPAPSGGFVIPPGTAIFSTPAPGPVPSPAVCDFGAAPTPALPQYHSVPVNIVAPLANEVLAQQMTALEMQCNELEKLDVWPGKSSRIATVWPTLLSESETTTILPYRGFARPYSASQRSQTQIRPRGFNALPASKSPKLCLIPNGNINNQQKVMMSPSTMVTSSVKQLVIRPDTLTPKPKLRLQFDESPRPLMNGSSSAQTPTVSLPSKEAAVAPAPNPRQEEETYGRDLSTRNSPKRPVLDCVVEGPDEAGGGTSTPEDSTNARRQSTSTHVPKLTKHGYGVSPSMEKLKAMSEADLAAVPHFTVFHEGKGKVEWEGAVDVRDVDLDYVVRIEQGDCSVYMADEENGTKPPQGTKLNRPASITLWNVLPRESDTIEGFVRKIKKVTQKLGAELISYDVESGEWIFRVPHF